MTRQVNVKWAGPNVPYIKLTNSSRQLLLNKTELVSLHKEIADFLKLYQLQFTEQNVGYAYMPWPPIP
jgi:hypothetical protein